MPHAPGFVSDLGPEGQRGWDDYFGELLNGSGPGNPGFNADGPTACV